MRARLLLFLGLLLAGAAAQAADAPSAAQLVWSHREIFTFRSAYNGADPRGRVERALERIAAFEARGLPLEIETVEVTSREGAVQRSGVALRAQELVLFTVLAEDLEPGDRQSIAQVAQAARERLVEALGATREQRRPEVLSRGLLHGLVATAAAALLLWLLTRVAGALGRRLTPADAVAEVPRRLAQHGQALLLRAGQIGVLAAAGAVLYAWLAYVLHEFPATLPLSRRLGDMLLRALETLGAGMAGAIPGLFAVLLIMVFAEAMSRAAQGAFRAVQSGALTLPGVHRDTAGATRRVVVAGIWVLAIVAAYPYMPGSGSGVFQGVSVLVGAMVTLGSAGIANQIMSGLTLVYARALKRGDHVVIGASGSEVEGVVIEVGTLATRIATMRNQEATVPNAVVVANPIRNFSRRAGEDGTLASVKLTIGYDAPWRQIHALLEMAAARTEGIRSSPAPRVMQTALSDFYVDRPLERVRTVSRLNAAIQDLFNEHGVQIMSPHFRNQPDAPVVVPRDRWFAAPARSDTPSA
jgi:small-conductance mechanosensitive channel